MQKGSWVKSKEYEEGGTFYTIILKRRLLLPVFNKTVTLYKNWKDDCSKLKVSFNDYDYRNYSKEAREGNLEIPDEKEIAEMKKCIKNLPEETKRKIYGGMEIRLFSNSTPDIDYGFEIQKINDLNSHTESNLESLSKKLSEKLYKKAFCITNILPL